MSKYVEEYSDVNVEGIDYFVKEESDGYLYKDSECTIKVNSAEMIHAFEMGDIIINDGVFKNRPLCLGQTEEATFVIYDKMVLDQGLIESIATPVRAYDEPVEEEEEEEEKEEPEEPIVPQN